MYGVTTHDGDDEVNIYRDEECRRICCLLNSHRFKYRRAHYFLFSPCLKNIQNVCIFAVGIAKRVYKKRK